MDPIDYLRVLRRRWPLIVLFTLLGAALGWALHVDPVDEPVPVQIHAATHTLITAGGSGDAANLRRAALVATVGSVPERVAEQLGQPAPLLEERVTTRVDPEVGVLDLTAVAGEADEAIAIADAFAVQLEQLLAEQAQTRHQRSIDALLARRAELESRIRELTAQLAVPTPDAVLQEAERQALLSRLGTTVSAVEELVAQGPAGPDVVSLDAADPRSLWLPEAPARLTVAALEEAQTERPSADSAELGRTASAGLGALLGFLVGIGVALVVERLAKLIRTRDEATTAFGLPVLAEVPPLPRRLRRQAAVVALTDTSSRAAESYRQLRSSLLVLASPPLAEAEPATGGQGGRRSRFDTGRPSPYVILCTSAEDRDAARNTASNLAIVLSETGRDVLLVTLGGNVDDHPLASPDERRLEGGEVRPTVVERVGLLDATTLGESDVAVACDAAIAKHTGRYEFVVLEAPLLLGASDASALIPVAHVVVVTARLGATRSDVAARSGDLLRQLGAPSPGIVLANAPTVARGQSHRKNGGDRGAAPPGRRATSGETTVAS